MMQEQLDYQTELVRELKLTPGQELQNKEMIEMS